jgi:hypothetical protein
MTKLQEILAKVSDARARNVSEENINEYLRRKGYSRDSFEDAVRYLIDKQGKKAGYQKALGDKFSPQFAGAVAREIAGGVMYEWGDEVEAFFRTLVTDETYEEAKNQINEERQTFQNIDPTATALMNVGGGIIGGAAEGAAAARLGMQLPQMLQPTTGQPIRNIARSATTGAMSGAGAGALTAAGADQNVGIGAAIGAATGGTITPAVDLGRAGLQRLLSGSGGNTPIGPPSATNDYDPNNRALRKLLTSIEDDTGMRGAAAVDSARQRLGEFEAAQRGAEVAMPDLAGRNLRKTTDALVSTPGPASQQISDMLYNRQSGQRERLLDTLQRNLAEGTDPERFAAQMAERRAELSPRYQAIQNDLMQDPTYQQIYQRDPRFADAQRSIQVNAEYLGEPTGGAIRTDQGIRPGPYTVRDLENTRQGVGFMIDRRPVESGYVSGAERRSLSKNLNEFMSAADAENPAYQQLRREGYDTRMMQDLNQIGYKDAPRMPPDQLEDLVRDKTSTEMYALRSGFVQRMKDQMNEVKAQAGDRTRDWSSPNMQRRMEILFDSPEQFQQFQREMDAERTMSETSGYVLGNSRTAERLANQDELGGLTPNEFSSAMQGNKLDLLARGATFADDLLRRREMRQMSEQLGPRLSGQGSAAIGQSLDDLQNYAALRDLMAQENARRNMFVGGLGGRISSGLLD